MQTQRRWMASMLAEAAAAKISLPWQRGARRDAWLAHNPLRGETVDEPAPAPRVAKAEA